MKRVVSIQRADLNYSFNFAFTLSHTLLRVMKHRVHIIKEEYWALAIFKLYPYINYVCLSHCEFLFQDDKECIIQGDSRPR